LIQEHDEMAARSMKRDIIDTEQLRAFEAVAETGSFTRAAAKLGSAQSSVSQQVAALEKRSGRLLVRRTTRSVKLTPSGTAMLVYVRSILSMAEDARRRLSVPPVEGVVKVGVADEFATTKLTAVLGIFRTQHPRFQIQFLTGRNDYLTNALEHGDVNIILAKCHSGRQRGQLLWRERLIWIGEPGALNDAETAVPLVTYLRPSETRDLVEAALLAAHRTWNVVAQGDNLSGLLAATQAGLGIMALGRNFVPDGLAEIPAEAELPTLGTLDYVIDHHTPPADPGTSAFAEILREFAQNLVSEHHSALAHEPENKRERGRRQP
jgi:DNA-binding transcriptional LysR family regulator